MTTKIKIDKDRIKERLKNQQEKASSKSKDPKDFTIFKPTDEGECSFRAVIYPHSPDPACEPFPERFYHYGFPGGTFYCPSKNEGEDCAICEFVWLRLTETKGTDDAKEWSKKLPSMCMLIPGLARGREEEGCKFFRVNTREDKPSDNYNKIYKWLTEDEYDGWMDSDKGFDMILTYKKPEEGQSAYLGRAKFMLSGIDLARTNSKFGTKKEYDEFVASILNVDEKLFAKKTTEDSYEVLEKFEEILTKKARRAGVKTSDSELNKSEGTSASSDKQEDKPVSTNSEDIDSKLGSLGL